jgi:hypothetical protein
MPVRGKDFRGKGMATQHAHEEAVVLAGLVFGKILNRQADRPGYEYVLYCFESGRKSVRDIVLEFISSEEFIDRFVLDYSPAHSVELVHKLLLGHAPADERSLKQAQRRFVRLGLRKFAERIVASPEYQEETGMDEVPEWGH